jgi:hypothetical protein
MSRPSRILRVLGLSPLHLSAILGNLNYCSVMVGNSVQKSDNVRFPNHSVGILA